MNKILFVKSFIRPIRYNFAGSFIKVDLNIIVTNLWQSLKPV